MINFKILFYLIHWFIIDRYIFISFNEILLFSLLIWELKTTSNILLLYILGLSVRKKKQLYFLQHMFYFNARVVTLSLVSDIMVQETIVWKLLGLQENNVKWGTVGLNQIRKQYTEWLRILILLDLGKYYFLPDLPQLLFIAYTILALRCWSLLTFLSLCAHRGPPPDPPAIPSHLLQSDGISF